MFCLAQAQMRRVEAAGIEPASPRCDRGVLPLYDAPGSQTEVKASGGYHTENHQKFNGF